MCGQLSVCCEWLGPNSYQGLSRKTVVKHPVQKGWEGTHRFWSSWLQTSLGTASPGPPLHHRPGRSPSAAGSKE